MRDKKELQVLIVDDNRMNQVAIRAQVSKIMKDVVISVANDGKESVDICNKKEFDLIFMDYNMPEMNGEEATRQIRGGNLNPSDKCIILTCSSTTATEIGYKGTYPGANDCLAKPINREELKGILEKFNFIEKEPLIENNQDITPENNLKRRAGNNNSSFFSQPDKALEDHGKNKDLDEEKKQEQKENPCRKYCTIL